MKYADVAIKSEINQGIYSHEQASNRIKKIQGSMHGTAYKLGAFDIPRKIGAIAGTLRLHNSKNPDCREATKLFKKYRPLSVVAVAEESVRVLPKLEPFDSPVISEPIIGKCGDIVFVEKTN